MKTLDLSYLNIPEEHPVIELLKGYGGQISNKTNHYITYIWATGTGINTDEIRSFSFYLVAPEIDRQHKLISIDYEDIATLKVILWPLDSSPEHFEVKISKGDLNNLDEKLFDIFNHQETRKILTHFLKQTLIKLQLRK
ncbi:MAG: hypothetical protein KQH79_14115 [Bacteroidetes bacterium]|nr:hypothetical protein [Bacteroidota bacterium]